MTPRTIVGSGPARRPLPMGREAVERAIRLCEWYRASDLDEASETAWDKHSQPGNPEWLAWLPGELHGETIDKLRSRLEAMP